MRSEIDTCQPAVEQLNRWLIENSGNALHEEVFGDRRQPELRHTVTWWGVKGRVVIVEQFPGRGFEVYVSTKSHQIGGVIAELEGL